MPPMDADQKLMVHMAQIDEGLLVTRSQAKRVAQRFECFKRVELDFVGVSDIGQAFADELFCDFAAAHPAIRITPVNTEPAVAQMIRRTVAAGAARAHNGTLTLPLIDVVHSHSITRLVLTGPRARFPRTASG